MCWKLRLQVSAAGVHRPPVGGIAGTEKVRDLVFSYLDSSISVLARFYRSGCVPGGSVKEH